ncbi:MAG TPA: CHAD domain containing protein [Microbacteriaceae bacterium]|jgi:CHAD domain-containing protein|nr:CHAD domain containing protein [Microbacteriaceae bacterium]
MASHDELEIERKYDVAESTPLPALHELPSVRRVEQPVEHTLEAVYFDTGEFTLAANHITLRRRTGGDDAGWHLKLPVSSDKRTELHEPLGTDRNRIPERLLARVRVHVRGRAVVPVVRLNTRRVVRRLHGDNDEPLAIFCDDHVQAERLAPEPATESWREWEVELVDDGATLLDAADALFAAAGIHRSASASKLARALGDRSPQAKPSPQWTRMRGTAGAALLSYLQEHVRALTTQDPLVRQDGTDSVHDMRIAARRLRSVLATYRQLIAPEVASRLCDELKWLGSVLGTSRDIQVINDRLGLLVGSEPPGLVLGPIASRIGSQLGNDSAAARLSGLEVLDSDRYYRLLNDLDWLLASPPLTDLASRSADKVIPGLIGKELKRLRRAARAAGRLDDEARRNLALHEVRKSAKRVRYAAEMAASVRRKPAVRLADAAEQLQTILGDHQDSVVARDTLVRLSTQAYLNGENGFSYGRLHALEQLRAVESDARYRRAIKRFPKGFGRG